MYFLVLLEMIMPNESFSTFFALVAFIVMVDAKMEPEGTEEDLNLTNKRL